MKIENISHKNTLFSGRVIFPKEMSPLLENFKNYAEENLVIILKSQPFDIFVREEPKTHKVQVVCLLKEEKQEIDPNTIFSIIMSKKQAEDKILMDKVLEDMKRFEEEIQKIREDARKIANGINEYFHDTLPLPPKMRKKFVPKIIGKNLQINTQPKYYRKSTKHK